MEVELEILLEQEHGGIAAVNGTGGLLIIYANNIQNSGSINSQGSNGARASGASTSSSDTWYYAHGGSSGGGSINIFYKGQYTNNGTMSIAGGKIKVYGQDGSTWNRKGGDGTITIGNISSGTFVKDE